MALGVAGGLCPLDVLGQDVAEYPPARTGLRGSHAGSFEVAHRLAWTGERWPRPNERTDREYDLIVVGGGISGLAAAFFYQQRTDGRRRVLILDNHDDFGGHAKRNEFTVDGRTLIGYGGSQSLDGPSSYSAAARKLLADIDIDPQKFYDYFDRRYFENRALGQGVYFSRDAYGDDRVLPNVVREPLNPEARAAAVDAYPLSPSARADLTRLLESGVDHFPGLDPAARLERARRTSYFDFLTGAVGVDDSVALMLRDSVKGLWGVGWDALSTLEARRLGMPGTDGLGLPASDEGAAYDDEPYIFHFPDGNAGVARALLRKLNPDAVPGGGMEDLVTARVDYAALDDPDLATRVRLRSTAVDVRHSRDGRHVDVVYVRGDTPRRVRGRHVVLACYNNLIPHLCPELPEQQADALRYAEKVPLVYVSMAVRRWEAFAELGYHFLYVPQPTCMHSFGLDFPVSMGDYRYTRSPAEPTILHGTYVPTIPNKGLSARDQHVAGRRLLYETSFSDYEARILGQLSGALEPAGFDLERDLAGLTVNRWPHGYAYEYNDFSDPPDWGPDKGPHVAGRNPIGRISIANSDAAAYAYVDGAIDAADRAIAERLA